MKNIGRSLVIIFAIIFIVACDNKNPETNSKNTNSNTAVKTEKDLKATIVGLEADSNEAWKSKNGKFFEEQMTDDFVFIGANGRISRSDLVKIISESPCEAKGATISEEDVTMITEDVALLTAKVASDYTCQGKAGPSPEWVATIYAKKDGKWRGVYHQTILASDSTDTLPPANNSEDEKKVEDENAELSKIFYDKGKKFIEAWVKNNTKVFDDALTDKYLELNADGRVTKKDAIKGFSAHKCKVKNHSLKAMKTTKISDSVALMTYKESLDTVCGEKSESKRNWATSVYVKSNDKWLGAFYMGTPIP